MKTRYLGLLLSVALLAAVAVGVFEARRALRPAVPVAAPLPVDEAAWRRAEERVAALAAAVERLDHAALAAGSAARTQEFVAAPPSRAPAGADEAATTPRLQMVFLTPASRWALIDDHLVAPGGRLPGGQRLAEVREASVMLVGAQGAFEVEMSPDAVVGTVSRKRRE